MRKLALAGTALITGTVMLAALSGAADPANAPLLQAEDLKYAGAFRLPNSLTDQTSFSYGGTALTYYPAHNSLLLIGHDWFQRAAEINIARFTIGDNLIDLDTATIRQPLTDVLQGQIDRIGTYTKKVGGMLPWNNTLIVSAYLYYDGGGAQVLSHFLTGLDFANLGPLKGPYQVGNDRSGFVSGYMTPIPVEWQAAFGGPALTGNCCLSVISRTSYGPAVSVFNPADIGVKSTVPAKQLLAYPGDHPNLGRYDAQGNGFNGSTKMGGVVFPDGTRSVLFFGHQGIGKYCYGEGTGNQALHGKPVPTEAGVIYCYDPATGGKGEHAYPYVHNVWAYDALDLVSVKNGRKSPWDIRPYRIWTYELPFHHENHLIQGVAYDPSTRRIFVSAAHGDDSRPLIHAFVLPGGINALGR